MDLDIRPQDDLFGHVNGRWLDEAEIPVDRSSWGPFVELTDQSEQQVHAIIESLAASGGDDADSRKIGVLYASFMDEEAVERLGTAPLRPLLDAARALRDVRELASFLGDFERIGGNGLFGSYVNNDDRDADRNIVYFTQGGLGLPDESYYRDDKFAEIREKYVAYLEKVFASIEEDDPAAAAATVLRLETRLAEGHWERAETRDVIRSYNLKTFAELAGAEPVVRLDRLGDPARRQQGDVVRDLRAPAVVPGAPRDRARRDAHRGVARLAAGGRRARERGVPARLVRADQLRLLRPHPQRHARAAPALEAGGPAGRGCDG